MPRSDSKAKEEKFDKTYVPVHFSEDKTEMKDNPREPRSRASTSNESFNNSRKNQTWTIKEKVALLDAVKQYGCADYKNLAKAIGVRDEIEVKNFLERNMERIRKSAYEAGNVALINRNDKSDTEKLTKLLQKPAVDLWLMIISQSIFPEDKSPDYSNVAIELFKEYAKEENECMDPNEPDFKKLYSFVAECCAGNFAGDLKPLDALILGTTLSKIQSFLNNFEDEKKFLEDFNGPSSFIPASYEKVLEEGSPYELEEMHEEMKKLRKVPENGIPLDDNIFNLFYENMKIRENINPLGINPAFLAEEEAKIYKVFQNKFQEK